MKSVKIVTSVITLLCFFLYGQLNAQVETVWLGGSPGHETDWAYYKNWSTGQIPDWSSDVIIPDKSSYYHDHYPEISKGAFEINSLSIQGNAKLFIAENSQLDILYLLDMDSLSIDNNGEIILDGQLIHRPFNKKTAMLNENMFLTGN